MTINPTTGRPSPPLSMFDRMKARMAALQAPTPGRGTPEDDRRVRHLVDTNRWDDRTWGMARRQKKIKGFVEDLATGDENKGGDRRAFDPAAELVEGMFQSFYRASPNLIKPKHLEREVFPAHKVLKELHEHPEFHELREITANDPFMSAVAVDAMRSAVTEVVYRMPPPPQPGNGNAPPGNGPCTQPGQGQGGQPSQDPADPEGSGEPEKSDPLDNEGGNNGDGEFDERDLVDDSDPEYDEWESQTPDIDVQAAMHGAMAEAQQEVKDLENGIKGIGIGPAEWRAMTDAERKKVVEALTNPEMKALSDMIGRMRRFALGARAQRLIDVPHEAYDVEQGADIRRLLKSQFALLGHPQAKYEFYRRYADKELLQFKMRGTEDAGKGPMIVAIDRSGSMHGDPMRWAVGVAEALRRFAADDGRDFVGIFFGSNHDRTRFEFPKGTGPLNDILAFIGTQAGGGTQFDGVLTECLERASGDLEKADVVFITDGAAHLSDEWIADYNAKRKAANVRQFSVFIGGAYDNAHSPVRLLERISDGVVSVSELTPQAMSSVFQSV